MKKSAFIILLLIVYFNASATVRDSLLISRVTEIINKIKLNYAPDHRMEIFNADINGEIPINITVETTVPAAVEALKSTLSKAQISAKVSARLLPDEELGTETYGVANLSVCNNRLTPDNKAELVTQALLGTPLRILKKERGFSLVRTPDNYISWTQSGGVAPMEKPALEAWNAAKKIVYIQEYGHSYTEPNENSLPVSDLVHGVILKLAGEVNTFYKVMYPDGRIAYIPKNTATAYEKWISRPNPDATQIISVGKTLLGVPYLWGGTSIKGVDCSGFTKTCYYLNGIILPRDASEQALVGENVDVWENDTVSITKCLKVLKPGDLLFFGKKNRNGAPTVTHTGMYIGNGEFIHSSGQVKINSMVPGTSNYSDLIVKRLVKSRRMLNSIGQPGVSRINENVFYTDVH